MKKKVICSRRWWWRKNVTESEHSKILPVIYCMCILIVPIPLFSFSAQNCDIADSSNGFLPADPCQFWSLIQMYMLAQEKEAASRSCDEHFQEQAISHFSVITVLNMYCMSNKPPHGTADISSMVWRNGRIAAKSEGVFCCGSPLISTVFSSCFHKVPWGIHLYSDRFCIVLKIGSFS